MSSILKALKKLEKEPAPGIGTGSLATTFDPAKIFKKSPKIRRPWRGAFLAAQILMIAAGVSLLGRYLLDNKQAGQSGVPGQEEPIPESGLPAHIPPPNIMTTDSGLNAADRTERQAEAARSATRIEITPAIDVPRSALPTAEPPPLLPRLDYSILRLQAVTWAVAPQDRFALIDDTILRKGDSIKGFAVDSIQEDHIVVEKGGEKWRVEFRLR